MATQEVVLVRRVATVDVRARNQTRAAGVVEQAGVASNMGRECSGCSAGMMEFNGGILQPISQHGYAAVQEEQRVVARWHERAVVNQHLIIGVAFGEEEAAPEFSQSKGATGAIPCRSAVTKVNERPLDVQSPALPRCSDPS